MSAKIIKTIRVDIKSCKDYYLTERTLCIICRDGKFGIEEKHESGRLATIIDCEYDYIDTFCAENGFTNMIAVLRGDKWGLYAFRWTVSSKSDDINCETVADCVYDTITIHQKLKVAFLMDETGSRYYNLWSGRLSDYCGCSLSQGGSLLECCSDGLQKWIDIVTDTAVYARALDGYTDPEKISYNVYIFKTYYENDGVDECEMDLVVYNPYLKVSYVVFDVDKVTFETQNNADYYTIHTMTFIKDAVKYTVSHCDHDWQTEEFLNIAEEIDYNT